MLFEKGAKEFFLSSSPSYANERTNCLVITLDFNAFLSFHLTKIKFFFFYEKTNLAKWVIATDEDFDENWIKKEGILMKP